MPISRLLPTSLLVLAISFLPASATSVELANVTSGPAGSDVVVRVSVDTDGATFQSLDASFTFDDTHLALVGVYKTSLTAGFTLTPNTVPSGGPDLLRISLFTGNPPVLADGSHDVAWVLFHVLAPATPTSLVFDHATTELNGLPAGLLTDGSVTPAAGSVAIVMPDDAAGTPSSTVDVPVLADPADGLHAFDVTVEFNPAVIVPTSVSATTATQAFTLTTNLATPGRAVISLFHFEPVVGTGRLEIARIAFQVVGGIGDETPLDLLVGDIDDPLVTYLDDGLFRVCADADGDGVTACSTAPADCDDTDPSVYPGAPQLCDGKNNDCDDPAWPIVPATEVDDDGDHYVECTPWVGAPGTSGGDCNDADGTIHPGATEICNGLVDEDCDGSFNNAPADASCADASVCTSDTCNASGVCVHGSSGACSLSGTVVYYRDTSGNEPSSPPKGVPDVPLNLTGDTAGSTSTGMTGTYSFPGVFGSQTVTPGSKLDVANDPAVSSGDAALLAQHVVDPTHHPLTPRQIVAGDVSNNGTISSFDASLIAQYSVGLLVPRAVPGFHLPVANATGADWQIEPPFLAFPSVTSSITGADFVGILYGDVTGNWEATLVESATVASSAAPVRSAPPLAIPRDPGSGAARILVVGGPTRVPGTHAYKVTLGLEGADGIVALDLDLASASLGWSIRTVRPVGLAATYGIATKEDGGRLRVALFGTLPMQGRGAFLEIELQGDRGALRRLPSALTVVGNEGQIPVVWDRQLRPALRAR